MSMLGLSFFRHTEKNAYPRLLSMKNNDEEGEGLMARQDGMKKAMEQEFIMTRDPSLNRIPVERLETARKQAGKMKLGAGLRDAFTQGLGWQERGPNNVGGRVRAILIDHSDATSNTVIAGSVGGGLWRTTNFQAATPTWTSVNDFLNNLAICALAQDPRPGSQNIMYAGTGEGYYNLDNIRGAGIFKSTDKGLTWSLLPATHQPTTYNFDYVQRLLVDSSGNIYAACRSYYCNAGGIMKSTDGGTTWTRVVGTAGGTCASSLNLEGADLELASNNDMYATTGLFSSTGKIFKSSYATNGASTGNAGTWTDITPPGTYYRIELAVAPSNPNRLYALLVGASLDVIDIRRSNDGGTTWTPPSGSGAGALPVPTTYNQGANSVFTNGQGWYSLNLAVDPLHPDTLVIGGLDLLRSYNAGTSWTQISNWTGAGGIYTANQYAHADQHIMVYDPANNANVIFGNDGGIFYSSNVNASGLPTFVAKNTGFNVTQYYAAALHPTTTNYIIAGAQDNGSHLLASAGMNAASTIAGGDGGFCYIDQVDGKTQIVSYVYSNYAFSVNSGANFYGFYQFTPNYSRFINPSCYDNTSKLLYICDSIGRYGIVSNINNVAVNTSPSYQKFNMSSTFGPRQVSAIKVDPNTANRVWFGVSDNALPIVVKIDNANSTPSAVSYSLPGITNNAYISSIDIENGNANHILVTLSNYGVASVYETTDGGTTWTSLDNNGVNLPDMPIRWGVFVPSGYNPGQRVAAGTGGILLGTELGVYSCSVSNGTSTTWSANNTGLANVRVDMLVIRSSDKMVAAATHGRGIFTSTLPAGALPVTFRSFSGKDELRYNRLVWQVENEQTNSGFELQRKYPGEAGFSSLGFVTGKNTAGRNNYSFNDLLVDLGQEAAEYRLRQVDMSGRVSYSPVIVVSRKASDRFIEYISSGGNDLFIRVNKGSHHQQLTLQFFDVKGALLRKQTIGSHTQHLDIGWLPGGIYVLNIMNNRGKSFTQKIWK